MAVRVDVGWLVGGFGRLVFCGLLLGFGFWFLWCALRWHRYSGRVWLICLNYCSWACRLVCGDGCCLVVGLILYFFACAGVW